MVFVTVSVSGYLFAALRGLVASAFFLLPASQRASDPTNKHPPPSPPVANLPLGLGCLFIGPLGGRWADAAARRWSSSPAGRLIPGLAATLLVYPVSTLVYAWTFQWHTHVTFPLVASFFMGAAICAFFPGLMSYVSILKQQTAAAAGAAVQAVLFISGGMFIQLTPPAMAVMGLGGWITMLVGVCFLGTLASAYTAISALKAGAAEQLPVALGAGGGLDPAVQAVVVARAAAAKEGKEGREGGGGADA